MKKIKQMGDYSQENIQIFYFEEEQEKFVSDLNSLSVFDYAIDALFAQKNSFMLNL